MERMRDLLRDAEAWLDGYGKAGWLTAMVLGFVVFVPIGLLILGYMLWRGRMGCWKGKRDGWRRGRRASAETGNSAFDAYREETLRRLEDEREAFAEFLANLRKAKDQAEFDQFLAQRRASGGVNDGGAQPA